ncbi:MAG TPA: type II toxin-antitoxin system Phd/YefM family antitoxin [Dongiaceae bacterium]|jgi:prevent-host-death family protein|nr:type II toxin-antitoxin system Phd/YefM family antitoxin [Dongiaceae bacterium]
MALVPATEVQKNFGAFHDQALTEPVRVTRYGRETVVILSAKEFHALKQAQRRSLSAGDLSDDDLAAITRAEIPPAARYSLRKPK